MKEFIKKFLKKPSFKRGRFFLGLDWSEYYMDKPIRKAVRCYLVKDKKVVVTKYKEGNKKSRVL